MTVLMAVGATATMPALKLVLPAEYVQIAETPSR
jgi:hypothetical protein